MVKKDMMETQGKHSYSIETTRDHLGYVEVSDRPRGLTIIEGELGEIVDLEFIEGIVLQISGHYGVIRIDITSDELRNVFNKRNNTE